MVGGKAAVDYFFLDDFGGSFKATVIYDPYFLIATKVGVILDEGMGGADCSGVIARI